VLYGAQDVAETALGTKKTHPEQALYIYDLAQLSKAEGTLLFPNDVVVPHQNTLEDLRNVPTGMLAPIVYGKGRLIDFGPTRTRPAQVSSLKNAWISAVTHHPLAYMRERLKVGLALMSVDSPSYWTFQYPALYPQTQLPVSGALRQYGIDYLEQFSSGVNVHGDVLYTAWIYLGVLVAAIPLLLRRRLRGDVELAAFSGAMILFQIVIVFTIPAVIYRYEYPIVVAGTAMLPVLLPWRRRVRPA
jgi:hypothetical protein